MVNLQKNTGLNQIEECSVWMKEDDVQGLCNMIT